MSRHELDLLKKAAAKFARECNTPEKATAHLIKIGYLNKRARAVKQAA